MANNRAKPAPDLDPDRVRAIVAIRKDGAELEDVFEFGRQQWGADFTEVQAKQLLDAADRQIYDRRPRSRGRALAVHLAQLRTLHARAVNANDFSTAARVLQDIARLMGFTQAHKDRKELLRLIGLQQERIKALESKHRVRTIPVKEIDNADDQCEANAEGA